MDTSRLTYSAAILAGLIVAGWFLRRRQRNLRLLPWQRFGIAVGGLVGATFAAKLPFIFEGALQHGLLGTWLADGKTILWGLAGGYVGVEVAKWSLMVRVRTGDTFVVPVALAVAIGRLGCFGYGCCFGIATNQAWGFAFAAAPDGGELLRHPAQLYELVFHAGFAVLAAVGISRNWFATRWMLAYLVAYSLFRFVSEYWRPEAIVLMGMTFYQVSAIVIGLAAVMELVRRSQQIRSLRAGTA